MKSIHLLLLSVMLCIPLLAQIPGTVEVTATIAPGGTNSPFGVQTPRYGYGGFLTGASSLAQLQDLNWFPLARRTGHAGMLAVLTNGLTYQLASDLTTWNLTPQFKTTTSPFVYATSLGLTNYWAYGDSHTRGQVNLTTNWAPAGFLSAKDIYTGILATNYSLNLTNRAVSGSTISYNPLFSATRQNTLQQMNVMPLDWSGIVTIMHGYNETGNNGPPMEWQNNIRQAWMAMLGRLYASEYTSADGKYRDGSANATFSSSIAVTDEGFAGQAPFPTSDPTTDTRKALILTGTDSIEWTGSGQQMIWSERTTNGGSFIVYTNGVAAVEVNCEGLSYRYQTLTLLPELSSSTTISITNSAGTNYFLATGKLLNPEQCLKKVVVVAGPIGFGNSPTFLDEWAGLINGSAQQAAQEFEQYPVWVGDVNTKIDVPTMLALPDPNHPNLLGQRAIASALDIARPPNPTGSSVSRQQVKPTVEVQSVYAYGILLPDRLQESISLIYDNVNDVGYITSADWSPYPAITYTPMVLRGTIVSALNSGIQVKGTSTAAALGTSKGLQFDFAPSVDTGYITSIDWSTTNYLALSLRASSFILGDTVPSLIIETNGNTSIYGDLNVNAFSDLNVEGDIVSVGSGIYLSNAGYSAKGGDGGIRYFQWMADTNVMWRLSTTTATNDTGNIGTDLVLGRYDNNGALIDTVLKFQRSDGSTYFAQILTNAAGITIGEGSGNRFLNIDGGTSSSIAGVNFQQGGVTRFRVSMDASTNLIFTRYDSSGTAIDNPINILSSSSRTVFNEASATKATIGVSGLTMGGNSGIQVVGVNTNTGSFVNQNGMVFQYTAGSGYIDGYNPVAATFNPLTLRGTTIGLNSSGTAKLEINTTGVEIKSGVPITLNGSGGPIIRAGTDSPEASITAGPGSLYTRNNAGAGEIWLKTSGTGNTGWTQITIP